MTTIALCIIGCSDKADARTPVTQELESTPKVVVVPNTETISYHLYRQEWRRVNNKPAPSWAPDITATVKTNEDSHEIVEINVSDLSFQDAFRIEFLGKGEGHTFYWRGKEYTTNLLDVIRRPASQTDPFIERIVKPTTVVPVLPTKETTTPTDGEDLREGGGDQGTIE